MRRRGSVSLALAGLAGLALPALANDRVHVVRPGETLWQITEAVVGDPHRWPELYRANRDQIKDPSTLYPGQRLAIPDFPATRPGPESEPPLRSQAP